MENAELRMENLRTLFYEKAIKTVACGHYSTQNALAFCSCNSPFSIFHYKTASCFIFISFCQASTVLFSLLP